MVPNIIGGCVGTAVSLWARTEKSLYLSDNAPWSSRTETGQYDCAIPNTKYCSQNDTSSIHWKWITLSSCIKLYDSCHDYKLHSLTNIGQWSSIKLQPWRTGIWLTILCCTNKWECQPCYRPRMSSIHTHTQRVPKKCIHILTHWHIQTAVRWPDSRGRFLHSRLSDGLSHRCLFF